MEVFDAGTRDRAGETEQIWNWTLMPDVHSTPPSRRSTLVTIASFACFWLILTIVSAIRDDASTAAAISVASAVPLIICSGIMLWRNRRRRRRADHS
ncbi:hypothetical protein [Brevibacterium otitidis]|uniref:PEP-CTERM protein-sorting domain-containing protein n=1 Tax=Brevibacterium otitidis TaxID=53364 RepID=A0ABV5X3R9_9MICO